MTLCAMKMIGLTILLLNQSGGYGAPTGDGGIMGCC